MAEKKVWAVLCTRWDSYGREKTVCEWIGEDEQAAELEAVAQAKQRETDLQHVWVNDEQKSVLLGDSAIWHWREITLDF